MTEAKLHADLALLDLQPLVVKDIHAAPPSHHHLHIPNVLALRPVAGSIE